MENDTMLKYTVLDIQDELVALSELANQALIASIKGLLSHDSELARKVSADDVRLNDARLSIEEHCRALIAQNQPLSPGDLHLIIGAVNVATNLERIGDHAAGIAYLTLQLNRKSAVKLVVIPTAVTDMAEVAREMVEGAVEAFLSKNDLLAERIVRRAREIEELQEQIYRELAEMMKKAPIEVDQTTLLLSVARNLERIGDRAANICERAIYVATGELKEFR